ncbi:hypothetical protein H7J77_10250 [Mycolicibacillus parakoreensis]|uniref:DUF559 domain-containing protein n=1 Tax=Mycolicibacillus parakoreensis TaxID=1069221 RepID=A0ABY3TXK6_9MYCO|nr:hypothetical protein [Mycolicibacillus parakoreensis]MCV7315921.1 hypothetical protein [Mycolicibacillus parakoreensis]ULN52447.1 hypothetical protein MIU77_16660 [Mycolicibacillus parakoreensis]
MQHHQQPVIGSEMLAAGVLSRHQLRSRFCRLFPDVYLDNRIELTLRARTVAAWLWSGRRAVIAGRAAAALHDTEWVDRDTAIEMFHHNARPPRGVIVYRETLAADEVVTVGEMAVTTTARTAFDLARHAPRRRAVARLDALARATGITAGQVTAVAEGHRFVRGLAQLRTAVSLMDAGAQSPQESYLRLTLIDAGFPRPRTQIPVPTPQTTYYVDMGWEDVMVAAEYDGEHHLKSPQQWAYDIARLEHLAQAGWIVIRVVKTHRAEEIIARVAQARALRGARDRLTAQIA